MAPILEIENLKKSFRSPDGEITPIVDVAQFALAEGEQMALHGGSGSGKTTFLNLIAGILQADAGRIAVAGQAMTARSESERDRLRAQAIGYVFQTFNLLQGFTALENVALGMLFGPGIDYARARQLLERVGLRERLDYRPRQLSVGQQQRVAVARLIVQQPRLVLADEPVSALDLRLGREIIGLLCQLAQRDGVTLVVNLHTLDLLQGHFDRVIALRGGRLFWQGEPAQITQHLLRELYGAEYRALHLDEIEVQE